jgi:uncharacterized protein (DUF362 family)
MDRREFVRRAAVLGGVIVGGRLAGAELSEAASVAAHSPAVALPDTGLQPVGALSPTQAGSATIALVKTKDRAVGVRRAIDLLAINPVKGSRVLLKPNFNSADPAPGSTHPDVLRALLMKLNELGARAITVGERSGMGVTRRVMQQQGVFALAKELGFQTVVFDELAEKDWVLRQSKDDHWSRGYAVPRLLLDSEVVVQTCNLKTHRFGGHVTLSLKNSVGFAAKTTNGRYNYMNELHGSRFQRAMIAEINRAYSPALIVMDGVEAFLAGGPDAGKKASTEVVLAGTDRIAMDAVGVAILRFFGTTAEVSKGKIFEQAQLARAVELGLGVDSPAKIQIITNDPESEAYAQKIRAVLMQ